MILILLHNCSPLDIIFDFDREVAVSESIGEVLLCAQIAEGFIERELEVTISLTIQELLNEASSGKTLIFVNSVYIQLNFSWMFI